jgi:hypothetical protein
VPNFLRARCAAGQPVRGLVGAGAECIPHRRRDDRYRLCGCETPLVLRRREGRLGMGTCRHFH